jgi:hypothetical protein
VIHRKIRTLNGPGDGIRLGNLRDSEEVGLNQREEPHEAQNPHAPTSKKCSGGGPFVRSNFPKERHAFSPLSCA